MVYVGIDVSKDRLDVHVLPDGAAFAVARDGEGLAELVERMGTLGPERIAVEATGGFETVVAAALAGASLPVVVGASTPLRPGARAPREDRSARRGHDRPLRRGDQAGLA
jgi:transposase